MRALGRVALRCIALGVLLAASCLQPTEMEIDITSNACDRLQQVAVYVGGATLANAPTAVISGCPDKTKPTGAVGSLVIVPSGSPSERVQISVVGTLPGAACDGPSPSGGDCIVAKRALSFSPHTPLTLPIELSAACAGFACPDPSTQSCTVVAGVPTCVGDNCDSNPALCSVDGGGIDAGPDAPLIDASDAQTCPDPNPLGGTPTLSWSFENPPNGDGRVHEDQNLVSAQSLVSTSKLTTDQAWGCNYFLETTNSMPQPLAMDESALSAGSFVIAFEVNASADGKVLALLPSTTNGGFIISSAGGALQVYFDSMSGTMPLMDTVNILGGWHSFAMEVQSNDAGVTGVKFWRDGKGVPATGNAIYVPAYHLLLTGGNVWIDQLRFIAY
jgi:hypothetical protein